MKYIGGRYPWAHPADAFKKAWARLLEIVDSMGDSLVSDLYRDLEETIDSVDSAIQFLVDDDPRDEKTTRREVVIEAQLWAIASSDAGKSYARGRLRKEAKTFADYLAWLKANYPWPTRTDPIPSWRKRLKSLKTEKNPHAALKKYCDFLSQTQQLREQIDEAARGLDEYIQRRIDEARGK
jgi:hypothetical protein